MPDTEPTGRTFEGDFDEDKAKRLIANLDAEIADLKARHTAVSKERDDFKAAAEKSGADRDKALSEALQRAEDAERTLAIKKHNLPDDVVKEFADYLTGSAEEVDAKAARLAARLAPPTPEGDGDEGDQGDQGEEGEEGEAPTPPVRPRPSLTPGHGAEESKPFDAVATAKAIRNRRY